MAGVTPMVITADGKRAGATEQLAAFTRLLGLNLVVACHPVTLGRALARRAAAAPVLIDTPGCDPFDPAQLEELTALAAAAGAAMVLVLPAGLDAGRGGGSRRRLRDRRRKLCWSRRGSIWRAGWAACWPPPQCRLALTEAGIGPGAADGLHADHPRAGSRSSGSA